VIATAPIAPSETTRISFKQVFLTLLQPGRADPQKFAEAKGAEGVLPSNHSPFFAPD